LVVVIVGGGGDDKGRGHHYCHQQCYLHRGGSRDIQGDTSMVTIVVVVVVVVVVMSGGDFLTSIIDCDDNQPGGLPTCSWWVVCQAMHDDSNHLHLLVPAS